MRTFSLLFLLFGAASTSSIVANLTAATSPTLLSTAMLSAQTEQANDVNPRRGGGRRRLAEDIPIEHLGESDFSGLMM
jgi:hypothetical protein